GGARAAPAAAPPTLGAGRKTTPGGGPARPRGAQTAARSALAGGVPGARLPPVAGAQVARRASPPGRVTADGSSPGGSTLGAIVGAVLVTMLSVAAAVAVWRRRARGVDAGT